MKPSIKNKTKGILHEVKGAVKEEAGKIAGDPELEIDGQVEKQLGKAQQVVGKIEKKFGH